MDELDRIYFVGDEPPARRKAGSTKALRPTRQQAAIPPSPRTVSDTRQPDPFFSWLFGKAGLDAMAYRPQALQRRLSACLRCLQVHSTQEAIVLLEQKPELLHAAISSVLIGVSEFFRDPAVFEHLRSTILPALLRERPRLRICSAGCSEGQELYSIAMLLDDLGGLDCCDLVGLDCRQNAIASARSGLFDISEMAGLGLPCRQRYFEEQGQRATVILRLREKLQWHACDLFGYSESSGWDIILFRNVAIYLEQPDSLWERLAQQLTPGGILVTGKAEQPPRSLPLVREWTCVYRKTTNV